MKQTFVKTIQGHEMEFARLLYPLRYNVIVRVFNADPIKLLLKKDEKDNWSLAGPEAELPRWIHEVTLEMEYTIRDNEKDVKVY